jgi:DNA-binding response OmpR family regulator
MMMSSKSGREVCKEACNISSALIIFLTVMDELLKLIMICENSYDTILI